MKKPSPSVSRPVFLPKIRQIRAPDFMKVVWKHLTEEVCDEVFEITRDGERQREWTLFALLRMWMGLLQTGLASQTVAVEACGKKHPLFPRVEASPESFFLRIQSLEVLRALPRGSLTVNDRYYPKPVLWEMLKEAGVWMVSRYNRTVGKKKVKVLKKVRTSQIAVDDGIVSIRQRVC